MSSVQQRFANAGFTHCGFRKHPTPWTAVMPKMQEHFLAMWTNTVHAHGKAF
jgi:hypothetical protein